MKTFAPTLQAGIAFFTLALASHGAVVSTPSSADVFLTGGSANASAGSPSGNYGGAGALMISPAAATKGEIQTLLKFDLNSVKTAFDATYGAGNWLVDNITLQLGTNFGTPGAQPNNAIFNSINGGLFAVSWQANDSWVEGTGSPAAPTTDGVTFNTLPTFESGADEVLGTYTYTPVGNTSPPAIPPATYSLGLATDFLTDVSAGSNVSLRLYAADTAVGYLFNSRTYGTTANRPVLLVSANAVPEPGTAGLLLLAAAGVFATRRRAPARLA